MSRSKYGHSTLSGLIDSDSDDVQFIAREAMPTPDSAAENKPLGRKGRGKGKAAIAAKVTKTKAPARRTSGRLSARFQTSDRTKRSPKGAVTAGKRKALADKTNQQYASDTEEVEEFEQNEDTAMGDELDSTVVAMKELKSKATKNKASVGRGQTGKGSGGRTKSIDEISVPNAPGRPGATKKKAAAKQAVGLESSPEKIILESQVLAMEVDDTAVEEAVEAIVSKTAHNSPYSRSHSRTRQPSVQRRRAASGSDTERNDPSLRRKLGDITKKYDSLNVKYQDLREIGIKEAERNFERLRKQSEEKTAASERLIASLKADVETQSTAAKDFQGLKKKVESQGAEIAALKTQINQMTITLSEAHSENKTLAAKLAASRTTAASAESVNAKIPGSAVKASGGIRMMGTAEAAQAAQAAQLKEDLYSDLTGLLIRSVKREAEDDVYDCIQTGRNGTLHFKLAVANEKSAESYEDAQCQYVPQLDPGRDKTLMGLLPDYLVEEITFPRPQAARFYARVGKALTEKVE